MKWFQMWVKHTDPAVDQIEKMKRCDPILQGFACLPEAPDGTPVTHGGVIEVRGYNELGFDMAKKYLQEQGFEIDREQENA